MLILQKQQQKLSLSHGGLALTVGGTDLECRFQCRHKMLHPPFEEWPPTNATAAVVDCGTANVGSGL